MTKKLMMLVAAVAAAFGAWADTETVGGYTWHFTITNGVARIGAIDDFGDDGVAVDPVPVGTITVPSVLGGCPVGIIGPHIFGSAYGLDKLILPESVTTIERCAFYGTHIKVFELPSSLRIIESQAFDLNDELNTLVIPENVNSFDGGLGQCRNLRSLYFKGNAPMNGYVGLGARLSMTTYVVAGSTGWKNTGSTELPEKWMDRPIKVWESAPQIKQKVIFSPNGGIGGGDYVYDFGSEIGELPSVSREGYSFDGWYDNNSEWITITGKTIVCGDIECHAEWSLNRYSVAFDPNGGWGGWEGALEYGSTIIVPYVEREGYVFVGWQPEVATTVLASNVTYTAQWREIPTYTVTFDANGGNFNYGGSYIASYSLMEGEGLYRPNEGDPWREGFSFAGWFTDPSGGEEIVWSAPVDGNKTFYAHWQQTAYLVSFVCGGDGSNDWAEWVTIGNDVRIGRPGKRKGFVFDGWYTEENGGVLIGKGGKADTYTPFGDIVLYAHWKPSTEREVTIGTATMVYDQVEGSNGMMILGVDGALPEEFIVPSEIEGNQVVMIGPDAFVDRDELRSVAVPGSIRDIGEYGFSGSQLREVVISNGVERIGAGVFEGCEWLRHVTIPSSVIEIGEYAFDGCERLSAIYVEEGDAARVREMLKATGNYIDWRWDVEFVELALAPEADTNGGCSGSTIVKQVAAPYAITNALADRAIASVTVDGDCAIDEFVLKDGEVYDTMLRIVNTADHDVKLTLPAGYDYETFEGVDPLTIPANSRNMLSITRTDDKTFLVSREKLKTIQ